jgi:intracellular multiplication protein IcmO
MSTKQIRGVKQDQEINPEVLFRDTRPFLNKFGASLTKPMNLSMFLGALAFLALIVPILSEFFLLISILFFIWGMTRKEWAPIRIPIQSEILDPGQPHPATGMPDKAQGIFYIGNDQASQKEVWITNSDCRQHFLVLGTTGAGKSLPNDQHVRVPSGWRPIGELRPGDLVCTPDGGVASVAGVYPQGVLDIYEIEFEDGRVVEACPEHLWEVRRLSEGGAAGRVIMRTREIMDRLQSRTERLFIRLTQPVELTEKELPIDPYVLGALLGHGAHLGDTGDTKIVFALKGLDLIDAEPGNRFIPEIYLEGSVAQRASLLEGFMEGDRILSLNGDVLLTFPGERLADDVAELVRSLGGIAWKTPIVGTQQFQVAVRLRKEGDPGLEIVAVRYSRRSLATCIKVNHPERLFITQHYVVTHNTEALLGFSANAISWGSGFLFCDGKGDVALFAKVYALARLWGREDDLLVLNYMTGNSDIGASGGKLMSNTLNPFATGSSDNLTQMVVSLMDDVGGDGAMWKGRATAMLTGVMRALTWLREQNLIDLNVGEIRDHMNLKKIIDLADATKFPDMPQHIRKSIRSYLLSLPGFQEDKGYKQSQTTLDQHGYLEMQFTKILGNLADVYGHIFNTPYGEIDMYDVVLNRRILVIMLPALEKSGDEIANLGKIVVATLKGMMGATLGSQLEGNWEQVVENRPTNSPSPFLCILDEVGYYTVEGMALMAAQARSLGFSMMYASQDIPAMKRLNEKEADSIIANTNTKIFMRTEEAEKTGELALKSAGEAVTTQTGGYNMETGELNSGYFDTREARLEKKGRVHFVDLKQQIEGEMHILFQEKVIRAKSFYANPEGSLNRKKLTLRANHFIKVPRPNRDALESAQRFPQLIEQFLDEDRAKENRRDAEAALNGIDAAIENGDIVARIAKTFQEVVEAKKPALEASCIAISEAIQLQLDGIEMVASQVRDAIGGSFEDEFSDDGLDDRFSGRPPMRDRPDRRGPMDPMDHRRLPPGDRFVDPDDDLMMRRRGRDGHGLPPDLMGDFDEDPMIGRRRPPPPPFERPMDDRRRDDGPSDFDGGFEDEFPPLPDRKEPEGRAIETDFPQTGGVDKSVMHGVVVDSKAIIDMTSEVETNDNILKALQALDMDNSKTADEVDKAIDRALSGTITFEDETASPEQVREASEGVQRTFSKAVPEDKSRPKPSRKDEEKGDEEEIVVDFLNSLLSETSDGEPEDKD